MTPIAYAMSSLRRRPLMSLLLWSIPETLPAALIGVAIARAVDTGFLVGQPVTGLAWLGAVMAASLIGAVGSRQVLRRLGNLVEPVRDDLVKRVVAGALRNGVAGRPDDGAVARLSRQVEIVRDTFAGLIVVSRSFLVALIGTVAGLVSLAPILLLVILPPVLLGFAAFLATLNLAASRLRASVYADERLATTAGDVLTGARDMVACGAEEAALALASEPIEQQAAAERALAAPAVLRTICFAIAGWAPLILVLAAGPWLVKSGLSAGEIMGGLTYVLFGLQPAVGKLMSGLGGSGLRFVVTLKRILDVTKPMTANSQPVGEGGMLVLRQVTFAYGRHSEPVLRKLDLVVHQGQHLAVLGPSGIGKSTLAAILCGLLRPDSGTVEVGGHCVLIPQEAYVFTGTVRENLCYLRTDATDLQIAQAVSEIGAEWLLDRLDTQISPGDLSAGERQLVSLVRAYICQAPITVLDEATCHLDPAAERRAEEAFARQGNTLIVIAHRISSALRAPRVLVLDGVDAAVGDHATLASHSPLYRELLGHWADGSDPAGILSDSDGFDSSAAARLRHHTGKVIANGAMTEKELERDVPRR
ncbi:MAG TPA: antibiotic ABC transporter ATP-binding protein [Micromonosporaceae bacterium]|nr:antibiotic ABC transporter ATP-binding protein [Micromonosporaceae bacterium]HCU49535.1 antibiotic ABC transporter ATP-binding protein [Micromonosporaceae bacterium]